MHLVVTAAGARCNEAGEGGILDVLAAHVVKVEHALHGLGLEVEHQCLRLLGEETRGRSLWDTVSTGACDWRGAGVVSTEENELQEL